MSFAILSTVVIIFGQISGNFFQFTQEEPQCLSRFDHDFKVIQKLVELDQKIMAVDQRSTILDIEKKLNELERRLSSDDYMKVCCPAEWTYYNNSCYSFVNDVTMSWSAALLQCETYGKGIHLVTMETRLEQMFLQRYVKRLAKSVGSFKYYWVGATDTDVEGVYVWQPTGQLVSDTGAFWYPGENPGNEHEDCAALWGDHDYTLHDYVCERVGFFICEKR